MTILSSLVSGISTGVLSNVVYSPSNEVPKTVAGLVAWFDASDTSSITNAAGAVSQWNDKSGNNNHLTQATGAAQPATGVDTVNGLNVVTFDQAAPDYMDLTSALPSTATVFVVYKQDNDNIYTLMGDGALGSYLPLARTADNGAPYLEVGTPEMYVRGTLEEPTTRNEMWFDLDTTDDAQLVAFRDVDASKITEITRGSSNVVWALNGVYAEILIYDSNLADTDMNTIGNYLADKWGIAWTDVDFSPVNTVAPVASGGTFVGDLLSVTDGTWTYSPSSYTYQWQRYGADISGATSSTYATVIADAGSNIRAAVTPTNASGSATANSNAIAISDFVTVGMTLDASWTDPSTDYNDLVNLNSGSARVDVTGLQTNADGILMESGGSGTGLLLYAFSGTIYFQCGVGTVAGPGASTGEVSWPIVAGDYVIEWSADRTACALYINGELIDTDTYTNTGLAGGDLGTVGQVGGGAAAANRGGWDGTDVGSFSGGTITRCDIFVEETTGDV